MEGGHIILEFPGLFYSLVVAFGDFKMDFKANKEQKAQNEVLEALLSDRLFNEFSPTYWSSTEVVEPAKFAERAFPTLARYQPGHELDELLKGHQWLTDLAIPSKRLESARTFQADPAHNLTILEVFGKLQFLSMWGSVMMHCDPFCCICYEMFKIMSARRQTMVVEQQLQDASFHITEVEAQKMVEDRYAIYSKDHNFKSTEKSMHQDFGDEWKKFIEEETKKEAGHWHKAEVADLYLSQISWFNPALLELKGKSGSEDLSTRAMSAFLVNSSNTDAYGGYFWHFDAVVSSWAKIKDRSSLILADFIPEQLWKNWKLVISRITGGYMEYQNHWTIFSDDIWSFCLAAGCSKANRNDPFASFEALRDQVSRQFAYTTDLHTKISDLNKQIILQQRMITALACRNIMENLTATTPGHTATEKWHTFLNKMFQNVEDENGKIPSDNPFIDLFDQHDIEKKYSIKDLKQMANELYSTLSRTIHNFQTSEGFNQYTPMPGQFDPMQIDFMAAMKPNFNINGDPNWETERKRYPGQVVDVSRTPKPAKQTKTKDRLKEPSSAPAQAVFRSGPDLSDLDSVQRIERSDTQSDLIFGTDSENENESSNSRNEEHLLRTALEGVADAVVAYVKSQH